MYKLVFFCCVNIISLIHAAPIDSDPKIDEILQLDFLNKCPAILNNNIDLHCKNVSIGNPPQKIDLINFNDFYCVGLLAADIQLCVGNNTKKILKNYDDLKSNIDKIKKEKPADICKKLKQMSLFNETKNIPYLKKWIEILNQNLHNVECVGLCTDVEDGHTNLFCSMVYYINNDITYAVIPDKKETPLVTKVPKIPIIPKIPKIDTATPQTTNKDNAQQKQTTTLVTTSAPLIKNVDKIQNKVDSTGASVMTTSANIKDNTPKPVVTHVDTNNQQHQQQTESVVKKPETPKQSQQAQVVVPQQTPTEAAPAPVEIKDENLEPVKTVQITEEAKLPTVNEVPSVEENPKIASNVESSSISSTVSGVRDDFGDEYIEDMDDIKENEDQLLPQTNPRKETIEILTSDQDRHRMPIEEGEDMEESNFFSYFMFVSVMFIAGYVVYHNKQKIMALLLEGRRDRNSRRRPNTASYRKLNSNLEEAVTSKCSGSASHVIY